MKTLTVLSLNVLILLNWACAPSATENTSETIIADSVVDDRVAKVMVTPPESTPVPVEVKKQQIEIATKKIRESIFLADGCCKDVNEAVPCCCDEVLRHYAKLLDEEQWETAAKARSEDIILNDCRKTIKEFQKKLDALEFNEE